MKDFLCKTPPTTLIDLWEGKACNYSGNLAYSDLYNGTGSATNAISYQNATFTSDQSQVFAMFPSGMNHRIISLFREIGDDTEFELDQIDVNGRLVISMSVGENATLTDKVQLFLLDENFNPLALIAKSDSFWFS